VDGGNFSGAAGGKSALVLHPNDNVGVALADLRPGDSVSVRGADGGEYAFTVTEEVAFGHKFALGGLDADAPVLKYGEEIGRMRSPVASGGWIHSHNMYCDRGMK
jgi:hypothetical protein